MEKNMETARMGYIGIATRIYSCVPSTAIVSGLTSPKLQQKPFGFLGKRPCLSCKKEVIASVGV